jgi:hypothetical protein
MTRKEQTKHVRAAEKAFRKDERDRAVLDEEAERVASDLDKTARLRELCLAREAALREAKAKLGKGARK